MDEKVIIVLPPCVEELCPEFVSELRQNGGVHLVITDEITE
jgi:hypothetical protein